MHVYLDCILGFAARRSGSRSGAGSGARYICSRLDKIRGAESLKPGEWRDVSTKSRLRAEDCREGEALEMEQLVAAGASAAASNLYCSTVEELQPSVAMTSDSVYASGLEDPLSALVLTSTHQHWTSVDYTTENPDDYNFIRKFPGRQILEIERQHIKLLKKIAEGGQGKIHIAQFYQYNAASGEYEPGVESCVAKVFNGRNCGQWPEEVFGLDALDVHICRFRGYCIDGDSFILLMNKYDCSLRYALDTQMKKWKKAFSRRPLHDVCVVILFVQIALGMRFLHENDILHRDLKADNIFVLLDPDGSPFTACIGDFDVASNVVGTLFWRAPEVLQALKDGKRPVFTAQADVYSYAMTCYEILTGGIPFDGVRASNYDMVLCGTRPSLPANLTPKMKDLIIRCWHQDPSMRPTFGEIVEELRGLHRELITGSEYASICIDEIFNNSRRWIGADPEACLVEVKELLQSLLVKYNHADFLVLGCEVVADMEQYQFQFGFKCPIPYSNWFPGLVLADSIIWRFGVFSNTLPMILEGTKILRLMVRIISAALEIPDYVDDNSLTSEEMAARSVELKAWSAECQKRIMPDNPHHACREQLKTGSGDDGFQACGFCKNAHDVRAVPGEAITSFLYVDNGSALKMFLPSSLLSSLQEMSCARY